MISCLEKFSEYPQKRDTQEKPGYPFAVLEELQRHNAKDHGEDHAQNAEAPDVQELSLV